MGNTEVEKKVHKCENCGTIISKEEKSKNFGLCNFCEEEGFWIDPAGGVHSGDDSDPASMYE